MSGLNLSGIMSQVTKALKQVAAQGAQVAPKTDAPPPPPPPAAYVNRTDSFGTGSTEPILDDNGNQTGFVRYDDSKQKTEEVTYYPGTTKKDTDTMFKDGQPASATKYNEDGKVVGTAVYKENGVEETIIDPDTGEVIEKMFGNAKPFQHTPEEIAKIKQINQELKDQEAKMKEEYEKMVAQAKKENLSNEAKSDFEFRDSETNS